MTYSGSGLPQTLSQQISTFTGPVAQFPKELIWRCRSQTVSHFYRLCAGCRWRHCCQCAIAEPANPLIVSPTWYGSASPAIPSLCFAMGRIAERSSSTCTSLLRRRLRFKGRSCLRHQSIQPPEELSHAKVPARKKAAEEGREKPAGDSITDTSLSPRRSDGLSVFAHPLAQGPAGKFRGFKPTFYVGVLR